MAVVAVEKIGAISVIRIDRADKLNAINAAVAVELQAAFDDFERGEQRVAVLSAAGERAFSAGADVSDLPELWRCIPNVGFRTSKPIIAATSGWCVGGGIVMVMMCDLMVSAESTLFYYPEAKLGLTGGMISSLAQRMPHKLAMEVMLLGRQMNAQRAYEVGLINQVVPTGQQLEVAMTMAEEICGMAPLVIRTIKRFVGQIIPQSPSEMYARTLQQLDAIRLSEDLEEGKRAFKEKRKPRFEGR